jgi:energy-converting hydrogenase Eha subunit A
MNKFLKPGLKVADQLGIPIGPLGLLTHIGVIEVVIIGFVICLIAIFMITAFSIGMQCMNQDKDHKSSYNFMVFTLIMAILLLILGIAIIVLRIVAKVYFPMI